MSMHRTPTFSIVIPTIGRQLLYESLLSALEQLGGLLSEIIIAIDFKARDIPMDFIEELIRMHPKGNLVKIVHSPTSGVAGTLNCAIQNSSADLVSWLSDDDLYKPNKILSQYLFLRRIMTDTELCMHPVILFSDYEARHATGNVYRGTIKGCYSCLGLPGIGMHLLSLGGVSGCTTLFSKMLWRLVGGFPTSDQFSTTQDYVFWLRCFSKTHRQYYDPKILVTTRLHAEQESNTRMSEHIIQKESLSKSVFCSFITHLETISNLSLGDDIWRWIAIQKGMGGVDPVTNDTAPESESEDIKAISRLCLNINKIALVFLGLERGSPESQKIHSLVKKIVTDTLWSSSRLDRASFPDFISDSVDCLIELIFVDARDFLEDLKYDYRYLFIFNDACLAKHLSEPTWISLEISSFLTSRELPIDNMFFLHDSLSDLPLEEPRFLYRSVFLASKQSLEAE